MNVVLTNPRNAVSAVRLGLPVVSRIERVGPYRNVINWGVSQFDSSHTNVINGGNKIGKAIDKHGYLVALNRFGCSTPVVVSPGQHFPRFGEYVVRPFSHEAGSDFEKEEYSVEDVVPPDHYATSFITPTREYRVWYNGVEFLTAKRIPRPSHDETDEECRSNWGYQFTDNFSGAIAEVKKALQAVPLDFAAFDLLWATEGRKWYILEANTAPSLDSERVLTFMKRGIMTKMLPDVPAPSPAVVTPPPVVARPQARRIKVMTMDGWQEINVNG